MSLKEITGSTTPQLEEEKDINAYVQFYKNSLKLAGENINQIKQSKSLKDVVGYQYEQHRKRIWEEFGFTVDKNRNGSAFDVDWSIYFNGKLVALEEDKGHYVDSCFLERCLGSFLKTINNFHKKEMDCPFLILSSFTKYSQYDKKLEEQLDIIKEELTTILRDKMNYQYLNTNDRFSKWFRQDKDSVYNPYEEYQNDELIMKDIEFMLSLK